MELESKRLPRILMNQRKAKNSERNQKTTMMKPFTPVEDTKSKAKTTKCNKITQTIRNFSMKVSNMIITGYQEIWEVMDDKISMMNNNKNAR